MSPSMATGRAGGGEDHQSGRRCAPRTLAGSGLRLPHTRRAFEDEARELDARGDGELAVDLSEVRVDRVVRDEQAGTDLAVGETFGDQLCDTELGGAEAVPSEREANARGGAGGGFDGRRGSRVLEEHERPDHLAS